MGKSKPKGVEHWIQLYLQAKAEGDKKLADFYLKIMQKLNIKVPK
jgi:hypothetical protein